MGKLPTRIYRTIYLAEWMDVLGVRPVDLEESTSITASYISNLSDPGGRRQNPSAIVMLEISEALGITVNDLYTKPPTASIVETLATISPAARQALLNAKPRK